jgi:futalosine hydrolase
MSVARLTNGRKVLVAIAAEVEARAVLAGLGASADVIHPWRLLPVGPRIDLVLTGVGKAAAAGAVARVLDPALHSLVLSVGIAGSYGPAPLCAVVGATESVFADEGVQTPAGFIDLASLGFPPVDHGMSVRIGEAVVNALTPHCTLIGAVATVSTCSGTDDLAASLQRRTGAIAEAMEGAAVGLVAHNLGVPFGELRTISNTTGDRAGQVWQLKDALAALSRVIGPLLESV